MSLLICKNDRVVRVSRGKGATVTFVNNDAANDVYFDSDANTLLGNNVLPGGIPSGAKLGKAGGQLQVANWDKDLYFRSVVDGTTILVMP